MTYAMSQALQAAVYEQLTNDAALTALVGGEVHDAPLALPMADVPEVHVTIGEEKVRDASTQTSTGAEHDFTVTVHSTAAGFSRAKEAAGAVCEALIDAPLSLSRGALINLRFLFAKADRGKASAPRRVALRFRAVLEDTV
ncbi:DUF3168 domain-containing protein [Halovulum sp. GXIMD14793]